MKVIILDCDGTATDADQEGRNFPKDLAAEVARRLGLNELALVEATEKAIRKVDPDLHGWVINGIDLVPSSLDIYLSGSKAVELAILEAFPEVDPEQVGRAIGASYASAYAKTDTVFRPGMEELAAFMADYGNAVVITNSGTEHVSAKMARLPRGSEITVFGDAKKYMPTPHRTDIPEWLDIPRVGKPPRRAYLRRGPYVDKVHQLISREISPDSLGDVIVVGDIPEFDLYPLMAFGATGVFVHNRNSLPEDVQYVKNHPRGHVVNVEVHALRTLPDLLRRLVDA